MKKQQITPTEIWQFVLFHEGQKFQTIRGNSFTYKVIDNTIQIEGNRYFSLSKGNFGKALPFFDPQNLGALPQNIVGRSYVWGILNQFHAPDQNLVGKGLSPISPKDHLNSLKSISLVQKEVTTIHRYIDAFPIFPGSTKLILGTIHPHLTERFFVDFFYGNHSSIWKILSESFPHLKLLTKEDIIGFLKKHKIAITDIIRQCDRKNETDTEDSKLFNIVSNFKQIKNGLVASKIDTIFFTSGFGKNNAAKLFVKELGLKIKFNPLTREFIIPAHYFGREIKCVVLYSPSGSANIGISKSRKYLENKNNYVNFRYPIAEFKRQFYKEKFNFLGDS